MGLGKTLTILSLIVATRNDELPSGYSGATLIGMAAILLLYNRFNLFSCPTLGNI
jgi:hypothetical protein